MSGELYSYSAQLRVMKMVAGPWSLTRAFHISTSILLGSMHTMHDCGEVSQMPVLISS